MDDRFLKIVLLNITDVQHSSSQKQLVFLTVMNFHLTTLNRGDIRASSDVSCPHGESNIVNSYGNLLWAHAL